MRRDEPYLRHILDAISDIENFMENVPQKDFFNNKEKQYAVIRALEIIGEATKNLSQKFKTSHKGIPWGDIAGMRDKLIHAYFGVKLELVWETIHNKLPQLKKQISKIVEDFG